jgi:hypothetical protein
MTFKLRKGVGRQDSVTICRKCQGKTDCKCPRRRTAGKTKGEKQRDRDEKNKNKE